MHKEINLKKNNGVLIILGPTATGKTNLAVEIASIPQEIRGFGYVKEEATLRAKRKWKQLVIDFETIDSDLKKQAAE